jgi:hypothetical protein
MKKQRKLVVIAKLKDFDDEAWKRLLTAYAYYLHDERQKQHSTGETASVEPERHGGDS